MFFINLIKHLHWFVAAFIAIMLGFIIYASGVHNTREDVCNKVGGVYVHTYSNAYKCISANVLELK